MTVSYPAHGSFVDQWDAPLKAYVDGVGAAALTAAKAYTDLATGAVLPAGAASGQVLAWDGSAWVPADPVAGSQWFTGDGPPPDGTGSPGDYYLDKQTGDVYAL